MSLIKLVKAGFFFWKAIYPNIFTIGNVKNKINISSNSEDLIDVRPLMPINEGIVGRIRSEFIFYFPKEEQAKFLKTKKKCEQFVTSSLAKDFASGNAHWTGNQWVSLDQSCSIGKNDVGLDGSGKMTPSSAFEARENLWDFYFNLYSEVKNFRIDEKSRTVEADLVLDLEPFCKFSKEKKDLLSK